MASFLWWIIYAALCAVTFTGITELNQAMQQVPVDPNQVMIGIICIMAGVIPAIAIWWKRGAHDL